jgi:hypothetical protein
MEGLRSGKFRGKHRIGTVPRISIYLECCKRNSQIPTARKSTFKSPRILLAEQRATLAALKDDPNPGFIAWVIPTVNC